MSTRSHEQKKRHGVPKTDPKWYPTTQGLNRWLNRMADRSDLTVRVLKHTSGAPARFVPSEAEIDINEGLISRIDPIIAGSPEFVVKHRAIAGACVHEGAHARHSQRINLPHIAKTMGDRHAGTFAMLEEGRCETQQWPHLNGVERLALQSMVLDIVLRDMEDDEGTVREMDMRGVVRLAGLLLARIDAGIVDISQPMGERMNNALMDALGTDYAALYDIAVRFSKISVGWYDESLDRLNRLTQEWMAIEDRIIPPDEGGDSGEGEGEGEGEGSGEGSGESPKPPKGKGKGKGKSDDESDKGDDGKSDKSGEGEGEGGGKSKGEGEDESDGPMPGDDDEGTVGDGSKTLKQSDEAGEASLGDYASSNVDGGTFADIFESVREAAEEAEHISGSRLREEVVAIHRADASAHAERRRRNAEAAKRWRR